MKDIKQPVDYSLNGIEPYMLEEVKESLLPKAIYAVGGLLIFGLVTFGIASYLLV